MKGKFLRVQMQSLQNFLHIKFQVVVTYPFTKKKKEKLRHMHEKHLVSPSHDSKTKERKRNYLIGLVFIKLLYIFLFYFF